MGNKNKKKLYNVKMTEKEVQLFCDIVATILDRDEDDFCGNLSIGYSEGDNKDELEISTVCGDDFEDIEETEETLEMALKYVGKQLLPIPTETEES